MIWLSPDFLQWPVHSPLFTVRAISVESRRQYELWTHAEVLLSSPGSDLTRVDGITTLHRAVDQRLKLLAAKYDLRKLPLAKRLDKALDILAYVGVVRPLMLSKLIEIRNLVEHENAVPPSHEECLVFLDFVWYFLRSTDSIAEEEVTDWELTTDDLTYGASVAIQKTPALIFELHGWLPYNYASPSQIDGCLAVSYSELRTCSELFTSTLRDVMPPLQNHLKHNPKRSAQDVYFRGSVRGPADALLNLVRRYLRVA